MLQSCILLDNSFTRAQSSTFSLLKVTKSHDWNLPTTLNSSWENANSSAVACRPGGKGGGMNGWGAALTLGTGRTRGIGPWWVGVGVWVSVTVAWGGTGCGVVDTGAPLLTSSEVPSSPESDAETSKLSSFSSSDGSSGDDSSLSASSSVEDPACPAVAGVLDCAGAGLSLRAAVRAGLLSSKGTMVGGGGRVCTWSGSTCLWADLMCFFSLWGPRKPFSQIRQTWL